MKFCPFWKFLLNKISILGGAPRPPLVPGAWTKHNKYEKTKPKLQVQSWTLWIFSLKPIIPNCIQHYSDIVLYRIRLVSAKILWDFFEVFSPYEYLGYSNVTFLKNSRHIRFSIFFPIFPSLSAWFLCFFLKNSNQKYKKIVFLLVYFCSLKMIQKLSRHDIH